jgi:hypothetical protein
VLTRKRALAWMAMGGVLGAALPIAFLVAFGDVGAYLRIQFVDVPAMYRFIWPRAVADILSSPWYASQAIVSAVGAVIIAALVLVRAMPRRALVVALMPLCGLVSALVQAKGFPYHFHPVLAGTHFQWLVIVAWLADRVRVVRRSRAAIRLVPIAACALVATKVATDMEDSPEIRAVWLLWGAETPAQRESKEYFARFPEPDFFPFEMRATAAYIRDHTKPGDRVQHYGMDPYVLFLAERASATPYIYAYDLDADYALGGGTGAVPNAAQAERIRAMRAEHEGDMLARLEAAPPAAFVFLDKSPLIAESDAWLDFASHNPRAGAWVRAHYHETAAFEGDHVWMRSDLARDVRNSGDIDRMDEPSNVTERASDPTTP